MEIIRGLHNLRPEHRGCVATIGNFDGIHLGHQAVLGQLSEKAAALGLPAVVMTFEPHPQEYFAGNNITPPRLTRFREKIQVLRRYAVDRVVCLNFNASLASMTAHDFIQKVLVDGLGVRYLVVGDDFRFGHQRKGDITLLRAAGEKQGFQVVKMHTFDIDGVRVSSTRIRQALAKGDFAKAEQLLGRSYRMSGRIMHGDKRGSQMGFPTANIYLHRRAIPLQGVHTVMVYGLDQEPVKGVANIGVRPTVDGQRCLLEVHMLDFDADVYGRYIQVEFLAKLRDEVRFDNLDALIKQIHCDVSDARDFFNKYKAENSRISASI